jgi:hypothetical protein
MSDQEQYDGVDARDPRQHLLMRRLDALDAALAHIDSGLAGLKAGFPGDDPNGHRAYHESVIRRAEERADFWRKLNFELAKWGLLLFLAWLLIAGWKDFLKGPK